WTSASTNDDTASRVAISLKAPVVGERSTRTRRTPASGGRQFSVTPPGPDVALKEEGLSGREVLALVTAIVVPAGESAPAIRREMKTWLPDGVEPGSLTFTWNRPEIRPGAAPA